MRKTIAENWWKYLLLGGISIGCLFLPWFKENDAPYLINNAKHMSALTFTGVVFPFMLVPVNFLYKNFFKDDHYDTVISWIAYILPVVTLFGLVFVDYSVHSVWYYCLILSVVVSHGYNIYLQVKN